MKKDLAYLKFAIPFVNIIITIQSFLIVIIGTIAIAAKMGHLDSVFRYFEAIGGQIINDETGESMTATEILVENPFGFEISSMLEIVLILVVMFCVRRFLKNIENEDIFVVTNIRLAKFVSLLLLIGSLVSSTGGLAIVSINVSYVVAAIMVWTISKVLERANVIAEENDFTI